METILSYPIPIILMLVAVCSVHFLERHTSPKKTLMLINIALHIGMIVFLLIVGAGLEELLLFLLISLTVAII